MDPGPMLADPTLMVRADQRGPPHMVLVDRYVALVDDIQEVIDEIGGVSFDVSLKAALDALPKCSDGQEWDEQQQSAIRAEITRHRAEVLEPAFAIFRDRKACRPAAPGTMRKEPMASRCNSGSYYREVLDGIDPRFSHLTGGAIVNSLTIGVSWPPSHDLWNHPLSASISSCHDCLLVLYFGNYRPGISSPGCYFVLNTWANSVAIVPPLRATCVITMSHCGIGTGVAILRHNDYYDYVLVELFPHQDSRTHLASNKATLFLWWSPSSSPLADGQWIRKEVLLPIPATSNQDKDDATRPPTYSFRENMVTGILVCDIDKLNTSTDDEDDRLLFRFIPLPEECVMKPGLLSRERPAEEHRTMICMDPETILFVSMDSYIQGLPIGDTVLMTWTLKFPLTNHWTWEKHSAPSLCVGDLLNDLPVLKESKNDGKTQHIANCPVSSIDRQNHLITSLTITKYERKHENGQWGVVELYEVSIDMDRRTVLELSSLESRHSNIFAADFSCCLQQTMSWESLQRSRSTLKSPNEEEVVDKDDEYWEWVFPDEVGLEFTTLNNICLTGCMPEIRLHLPDLSLFGDFIISLAQMHEMGGRS
ncbi:Os01g0569200 [Oryza sativa Japonica Group]|uniref:Os01g0569200 protein n=1 Tax=Oryza sativa subsp. japonica TaxID=39947 RepID=Q0JLU3_ORYSJ|nr:Os01g0569200 [Oryza sativa Japonica Group]|eukprot:NP_001043371.2 Os01g0569200 [Oryza sativa Japonica Group]